MSGDDNSDKPNSGHHAVNRRNILLAGTTLAASAIAAGHPIQMAQAQQSAASTGGKKPNILVIFGDDIGQTNLSAYSFGVMGYRTPNIDRLAKEGMMFTDYYAENSGRDLFLGNKLCSP
jgi:Sulfatase